jgi:hypothetical protein
VAALRLLTALIAGLSAALAFYAALYDRFNPNPLRPHPGLALHGWPLELAFGALVGWWVWSWFLRMQRRSDSDRVLEGMLRDLSYRRRGRFSEEDLALLPASPQRVRELIDRLLARGRLLQEEGFYRWNELPPAGNS